MNKTRFVLNQRVTWSDCNTQVAKSSGLGDGPFIVTHIIEIPPNACTCGGSFDDGNHISYGRCPYESRGYGQVRSHVEHSQLVRVGDERVSNLATYSGAYFSPRKTGE
mgnify:CR=1 FL=1